MNKIFISALFLGATAMGYAQETNEISGNGAHNIEEVTITTNRIVEKKTDAIANVTVIDGKKLQEFVKVSPDLSHLIGMIEPAMSLSTNTSNNRAQNLRGRSLLVLIDGIPQSTPLRATDREIRSIDPSAIERIEIVKGSTSIYGNGAIGGVMNIVTKKST